jgi:hypothetical protein
MRKTVLTLGVLAWPRLAAACPICFGQNDSPLAVAMNNGILLMLGVVVAVLGCFAAFFITLVRRARRFEESVPAAAGQIVRPGRPGREGIAQC